MYGLTETKRTLYLPPEQLEKRAADKCPKCGGEVVRHGNVLICRNCGTEPWEGNET